MQKWCEVMNYMYNHGEKQNLVKIVLHVIYMYSVQVFIWSYAPSGAERHDDDMYMYIITSK